MYIHCLRQYRHRVSTQMLFISETVSRHSINPFHLLLLINVIYSRLEVVLQVESRLNTKIFA